MKVKSIIAALAITLVIGAGATVYAETKTGYIHQGLGLGRISSIRGYDYSSSVLKDKLGMTDKEITDGLNVGKTMYDLAKDKGMTADEFKAALIEAKTKSIDKAVSNGTITKEQGDSIKENIKNNIGNCISNPGSMRGNGARGNGSRGNGRGQCYIDNGTIK